MLTSLDTKSNTIKNSLITVFSEKQTDVLSKVIIDAYNDLVKTSDFNELKSIVKELAESQKRTGSRMEELAEAQKRTETKMEELAEAQKRTENRMEELAEAQRRTEIGMEELTEAQKRTENRMEELAEAQKKTEIIVQKLAIGLDETNKQLGGLSRSVSYSLENEAYRMIPKLLKEKYEIEIREKLIRKEIGEKEINLIGKGKYKGKNVLIVGEAKLKLDESRKKNDIFSELEKKVLAAKSEYKDFKDNEIIRILITHYARKSFLEEAEKRKIIVIQSFEW